MLSAQLCTIRKANTLGPLLPTALLGRTAWVHNQCVLWCPEVAVTDDKICDVDVALVSCQIFTCVECGLPGATLRCPACQPEAVMHLPCAKGANHVLQAAGGWVGCPKHAPQLLQSSLTNNNLRLPTASSRRQGPGRRPRVQQPQFPQPQQMRSSTSGRYLGRGTEEPSDTWDVRNHVRRLQGGRNALGSRSTRTPHSRDGEGNEPSPRNGGVHQSLAEVAEELVRLQQSQMQQQQQRGLRQRSRDPSPFLGTNGHSAAGSEDEGGALGGGGGAARRALKPPRHPRASWGPYSALDQPGPRPGPSDGAGLLPGSRGPGGSRLTHSHISSLGMRDDLLAPHDHQDPSSRGHSSLGGLSSSDGEGEDEEGGGAGPQLSDLLTRPHPPSQHWGGIGMDAMWLGGTTGQPGRVGRCAVCVVQRKGKCGTDSAPKKCLRRQLVTAQNHARRQAAAALRQDSDG